MSYTIDASVFVAAARPVEKEHSVSLEFLEQVDQQKLPTICPTLLLTSVQRPLPEPPTMKVWRSNW